MVAMKKTDKHKTIIVFAPHPDDELIGCGGSLAKHASKGNRIIVVYMTSGESSKTFTNKKGLAKIREMEATKGAKIIGFADKQYMREPDGGLKFDGRVVNNILDIIKKEKPDVAYLPYKNGHKDHRTTNKIVLEALSRYNKKVKVLAYEVFIPIQGFNHVENITEFMTKKIEAIRQHQSQRFTIPDQRTRLLARFRGLTTGRGNYCEVFKIGNLP